MVYELWAIDPGAAEAVLREGHRWFFLSIDHNWEPLEMQGEREAFKWSISGPVVPVGRRYKRKSEAINAVRRVCLAAIKTGQTLPSESVQRLLEDDSGEEFIGLEEEHRRDQDWEGRLREMLRLYSRRLDKYFESRGLPWEEVQRLRFETFRRASEEGRFFDKEINLGYWIFDLARLVCSEQDKQSGHDGKNKDQRKADERLWWLQDPKMEKNWDQVLRGLAEEDLLCLSLWARPETSYSYAAISVCLRVPVQAIRERLERLATALGRSPGKLRDGALHQACLQLIEERVQ